MIPVFERPKTFYVIDSGATVIGHGTNYNSIHVNTTKITHVLLSLHSEIVMVSLAAGITNSGV
jgi:hypothetical protein